MTVARRIRSDSGGDAAPAPPAVAAAWLDALADDAAASTRTPLREFLWAFGPLEPPQAGRVAALAELWCALGTGDRERVREQLDRDWPDPRAGAALKQALLGHHHEYWWSAASRHG